MVLSSAKIGRSSWRYYQRTVAGGACEYYSEHGDRPGRWRGRAVTGKYGSKCRAGWLQTAFNRVENLPSPRGFASPGMGIEVHDGLDYRRYPTGGLSRWEVVMTDADRDRAAAERDPTDDVIAVLYRQHAEIKDALERIAESKGADRQERLAAASSLMRAHEAAEQKLIRPLIAVTKDMEAQARNAEESAADADLTVLEGLDVDSEEFNTVLARLTMAVAEHAEAEQIHEFPVIMQCTAPEERQELGRDLLAAVAAQAGG